MTTGRPRSRGYPAPLDGDALTNGPRWLVVAGGVVTGGHGVSATQVQAIREAAAGDFYAVWEPGFTRHVVTTLLAALDAAQARSTDLQTALAQTTNGYLHQVAVGTEYARYQCRLCGAKSRDSQWTISHHAGCPVQVLADSYREE